MCAAQERTCLRRTTQQLVEERVALIGQLRDYAVGKSAEHGVALAASGGLRANIMKEVTP